MTNLKEITFNVIIRHPGGDRSIVTVNAYDMRGAEYKAIRANPLATVINSSPAEMFCRDSYTESKP